jgi:hypothetical protein
MARARARPSTQERVTGIAHGILEAFQSGELPKALAQLFIHRKIEVPSCHWTWTNRLISIRRGHVYAAGYDQWKKLGRQVKGGERAFHILAPRIAIAKEDDEGRGLKTGERRTVGFIAVPVFGYLQTEGEPLAGTEDTPEFIDRLPLIAVARSWGLAVSLYAHEDAPDRLGYFTPGRGIALGVENLSTWTHELVHAADHRLGNRLAPALDAEVVAEFGGAILLECLGYTQESDRGGAYDYLRRHCEKHRRNLLGACTELLDRTCACVTLLLDEAESLTAGAAEAACGETPVAVAPPI